MTTVDRFVKFLNKPHDGRSLLAVISVVCIVSAFAFWIWPTPYREWAARNTWTEKSGKHRRWPMVEHRINRFTGEKEHGYSGIFGMVHWEPG